MRALRAELDRRARGPATTSTVRAVDGSRRGRVADGRGFAGGWGPLPGPWLEPGFREKGFEDLGVTTRIVGDLIDRFNRVLRDVASTAGFEHVRYLDLRGTLSNGPAYKTWWANELHPTKRGFGAVADRFAAVVERL